MSAADLSPRWSLVLYVSGGAAKSLQAVDSVQRLCDEEFADDADLAVIDVRLQPELAAKDGVLAVPTLIRRAPQPVRRLSGNFADGIWLRRELGLAPATPQPHGHVRD